MTNYLADIITYVRRIVKTPSNTVLTDALIIDYINRFWMMDVDARLQMFDMKTTYQFQTTPGVDKYNMPLYSVQSQTAGSPNSPDIGMYPVYQNMLGACFINGIQMPIYTQREQFFNVWPNYNQMLIQAGTGDGGPGPYTLNLPFLQNNANTTTQVFTGIIRGHTDMTGIIDTGVNQDPPLSTTGSYISNNTSQPIIRSTSIYPGVYFTSIATDGSLVQICDTGILLTTNQNYGLLMTPGSAPFGNQVLTGGYSTTSNTINYQTGIATNIVFSKNIPLGTPINAQCVFYQTGIPRAVLFQNNILTFRAPPNTSYLIEISAYLTPSAFFNSDKMVSFAYMCEYIARGAARKILSDVGDVEQFNFYEPFFQEQEMLVWKRSQRQFTATRTPTIYSQLGFPNTYNQSSFGV